ncbi:hypothetical protein [Nocardia nova]|uniref:hypothetical protein n=1 Tax=Nocardia nova TaxID=37330 RepID=UPI003402B5A4
MSDNPIPGLTPHTIAALLNAADGLAGQVRAKLLHSPRPVFLHYLEQSFLALRGRLELGQAPRPGTPAEQLCLHLLLSEAGRSSGSLDADLIRIHRALLPDRDYEELADAARNSTGTVDFIALGDALSPAGMSMFFTSPDPGNRAA